MPVKNKVKNKTPNRYKLIRSICEHIKDDPAALDIAAQLENEIDDYILEIDELKAKLAEAEKEMDALEDANRLTEEWDFGIGVLHFEAKGSIDLQEAMEVFSKIMTERGIRKTIDFLEISDLLY